MLSVIVIANCVAIWSAADDIRSAAEICSDPMGNLQRFPDPWLVENGSLPLTQKPDLCIKAYFIIDLTFLFSNSIVNE